LRIRIAGKTFELFTETSEHQIAVFAMILIFLLEVINLRTANLDTSIFELVITIIAGLGGYTVRGAREKKKAKKQKKATETHGNP
jgi:hypothetical protein